MTKLEEIIEEIIEDLDRQIEETYQIDFQEAFDFERHSANNQIIIMKALKQLLQNQGE